MSQDEFSSVCDTVLAANPVDKKVEDAVLDLEVAHKKSINAVKQSFNKELDEIQKDLEEKKKEYDKFREDDKKHFQEEIEKLNADYQKQMEKAQKKYQEDIRRVKENYESILESKNQSTGVVSRIQDEHNKELARQKEEFERIISVRENEIAALKRRIDDDATAAENMVQDVEFHRRLSDDEASAARRELINIQAELVQTESEYREMYLLFDAHTEKYSRQTEMVLGDYKDRNDELSLQLARIKKLVAEPFASELRTRLSSPDYVPTREEVSKLLEGLQKRKDLEGQQVDLVIEKVKAARENHEQMVAKFTKSNGEELEKIHKKNAEFGEKQEQRKEASRERSLSHRDPNELSTSHTAPSYPRRGSRLSEYRAFKDGSRRNSMARRSSVHSEANDLSPEPAPSA
ncbi:hypothetical protein AGDE_15132 [Angomonas deanei]|nr:hypothetical protein AGDE_15132 [Angomonas deanei]|eukprot:EPY19644.1 hypothetical protein AGDE_15132 [Angomonas deanei]